MNESHWLKIALTLDGQGGASPLDAQVSLNETVPYWVHLDYSQPESQHWLEQQDTAPMVISALTTMETRPRVTEVAGGLLVYLRGVNLHPGARPEDMIALRLWVGPKGLVSTQKRALLSLITVQEELERGEGPADIPGLVARLVDQLIWRMEDVIENLESEVEDCALSIEESPTISLTPRLSQIRRRSITLRRFFAPQREALMKLQNESMFAGGDALLLREAGDRLQRLLEDLDAAREHATLLQEEVFSVQNEAINDRMYQIGRASCRERV